MHAARKAVLVAMCSMWLSAPALAEDAAVAQRLKEHGGLSGAAAKKLTTKVTQRMNKAADTLASANDPLRIAMSQALFHSQVPPDNMAAAKMRLKLYAGLNEAALEALFQPKPGAIANCVRAIGATQPECEALVAAAGRESVADARKVAGGPAAAPAAVATRPPQSAPAAAPAAGGSRFGNKFASGFGGGSAAAAPAYAVAPRPQPAAAQQRFGAAPAAPAGGLSQKEAYQKQREAYLARQKALHEEKKQKLGATSAGASDAPAPGAAPVAVASAAPVKPGARAKAPPAAAANEAPAEEAPVEEAPAEAAPAALDGDFLDGLLADPLGGKK